MNSILVPLDGSVLGEYALPIAQKIARSLGATLHLVHVHVPIIAVHVGELHIGDVPLVDEMMDSQSRNQEQAYLDAIRDMLAGNGIRVTSTMLNGLVADSLARHVGEVETNLVVIATHGRGQLARLWFGSVTDALIRRTHTPLLVVKTNMRTHPSEQDTPFHHIMIPLDGSQLAEQIIGPALALGQPMNAAYTLIQIVEPLATPNTPATPGGATAVDREMTMRRWDNADRYLQAVARMLRADGLEVFTRVVVAQHPAATILEHARRSNADLITMSTHGRSGVSRLLLGSVADAVMRNAPTPVMVVHPQAA